LLFFPLDVFVGCSDGLAVDFDEHRLFVGILILGILLQLNELVAASLTEQGVSKVSGASLQELPLLRILFNKISDLLSLSLSLELLSFLLAKFGLPNILLNLGFNLFNLFLQLFLLSLQLLLLGLFSLFFLWWLFLLLAWLLLIFATLGFLCRLLFFLALPLFFLGLLPESLLLFLLQAALFFFLGLADGLLFLKLLLGLLLGLACLVIFGILLGRDHRWWLGRLWRHLKLIKLLLEIGLVLLELGDVFVEELLALDQLGLHVAEALVVDGVEQWCQLAVRIEEARLVVTEVDIYKGHV